MDNRLKLPPTLIDFDTVGTTRQDHHPEFTLISLTKREMKIEKVGRQQLVDLLGEHHG